MTVLANPAAERAVIGAVLGDPSLAAGLVARLSPAQFRDALCCTAWELIGDAVDAGRAVDPTSVGTALAKRGPGWAGKAGELVAMMAEASPAHADWHADLVVDAYRRRQLREVGARMMADADSDADVDTVYDLARTDLDAASAVFAGGTRVADLLPAVLDAAQDGPVKAQLATGLPSLDRIVALRPGQLVIVAARPSVGKSTLALNIARQVAGKGHQVVVVSLEMTAAELGERLLSQAASIPLHSITEGRMTDASWVKAGQASPHLAGLPLLIDDAAKMGLAGIRSYAQRTRPALLIVDYLQLIDPPRAESRQTEVAAISRGLKLIAKDAGCVVMACAQLNRSADHRADKKPTLSDLRDSGAIEQDADTVLLLHREATDDDRSARFHEAQLIVAKQRSGPTGTVHLGFDGEHSRFVELAPAGGPR